MTAPVLVLVACLFISGLPPWTFSGADIAVIALIIAAIGARSLDVFAYRGLTAAGEEASARDFMSYAIVVGLGGGLLWIIAHAIAV
jgi:hypothetical protein